MTESEDPSLFICIHAVTSEQPNNFPLENKTGEKTDMFRWRKQRGVDNFSPLTALFYKRLLVPRYCSDGFKINTEIR